MKINGTETVKRSVSVELSLHECFSTVRDELLRRLGIPGDAYERDGKIWQSEEHYGSHRWDEEVVVVEEPTEKQLETLRLLNILNHTIWEMPDRDE